MNFILIGQGIPARVQSKKTHEVALLTVFRSRPQRHLVTGYCCIKQIAKLSFLSADSITRHKIQWCIECRFKHHCATVRDHVSDLVFKGWVNAFNSGRTFPESSTVAHNSHVNRTDHAKPRPTAQEFVKKNYGLRSQKVSRPDVQDHDATRIRPTFCGLRPVLF